MIRRYKKYNQKAKEKTELEDKKMNVFKLLGITTAWKLLNVTVYIQMKTYIMHL